MKYIFHGMHTEDNDNLQYLALQYFPQTLNEVIASGKNMLEIFSELLDCIEQVHMAGYVHRDVKPDNFLA